MIRIAEITGILIFIALLIPSCNSNNQNKIITGESSGPTASIQPSLQSSSFDFATLYQHVRPSVVSVKSDTLNGVNIGTGFVFDAEGYIVTSYHVVQTEANLEVKFSSGEIVPASLVGKDEISDLAVLKLDYPPAELVPLILGSSEKVIVGETVAAFGNPFGLEGTITTGIVSGVKQGLRYFREILGSEGDLMGEIIVTDATINPGNSGGPLVNTTGEGIGIIRNIVTAGGKNQPAGIAFALPADIAKPIIESLVEQGTFAYPDLGFSAADQFTLEEIESLGLPVEDGIYITEVEPRGPAQEAGLIAGYNKSSRVGITPGGDVILAVDNKKLENYDQLMAYLIKNKKPGDVIQFTVLRGGEKLTIPLTIGIKEDTSSDDWQ